jgi:membrane-associated phospholipid phosphatase
MSRLVGVGLACLVGLAAVGVLHVVLGNLPGDEAAVRAARLQQGQAGFEAWRVLDEATDGLPQVAAATCLVIALALLRRFHASWFVAIAFAVAFVGNYLLKRVWERPRPELLSPVGEVSAYSLPAGHAAGPAALAVLLALVTAGTRHQRYVVATAVVLVALTGVSQLVLARHYPSDLVAGWFWGVAAAALVWSVGTAREPQRPRRQRQPGQR